MKNIPREFSALTVSVQMGIDAGVYMNRLLWFLQDENRDFTEVLYDFPIHLEIK